MKQDTLTFAEIGRMVLDSLSAPISIDEFVDRVLAVKTSRSKNPRGVVLNAIQYLEGTLFVRPDAKTIVPLPSFMSGIRFRRILVQEEIEQGCLLAIPTFWGYLPRQAFWNFDNSSYFEGSLNLNDEKGQSIEIHQTFLVLSSDENNLTVE